MTPNSKKKGEPEQYTDLLKKVHHKALKVFKEIQRRKSIKRGRDIGYRPARIWLCHMNNPEPNNLCPDNCPVYNACQNYKRVRVYFLQFGYIIYPYTLSIEGLPIDKQNAEEILVMGFYNDSLSNVLFVNSACFSDTFKDHPMYSAVNEAFHEFLHASSSNYIEYDILMASPNQETLIKYLSEPNYLERLLMMYDISELKSTNEPIHRFIANNKDTKCLLDAIFRKDKDYQPPAEYLDLYKQLLYLLGKLEDRG